MGEPILTIHEAAMEAFDAIDAVVASQNLGEISLSSLREMKTEPVQWVVENFIRAGATHLFFGRRRKGKTHLMLDMTMRIAAGDNSFLGFPILRHGRCLYFMLEEGFDNLKEVVSSHPFYEMSLSLGLYDKLKLGLNSDSDWERFEKALNGAILCVIDPLVAFGSKFNRSDSEDSRYLMNRLNRVAMKTKCAIIIVNHENKSRPYEAQFKPKNKEAQSDVNADRFKGSSELADLATLEFRLENPGGERITLVLYPGKHSPYAERNLYRNETGWLSLAPRDLRKQLSVGGGLAPIPLPTP